MEFIQYLKQPFSLDIFLEGSRVYIFFLYFLFPKLCWLDGGKQAACICCQKNNICFLLFPQLFSISFFFSLTTYSLGASKDRVCRACLPVRRYCYGYGMYGVSQWQLCAVVKPAVSFLVILDNKENRRNQSKLSSCKFMIIILSHSDNSYQIRLSI